MNRTGMFLRRFTLIAAIPCGITAPEAGDGARKK
jgi:hypothetical protein